MNSWRHAWSPVLVAVILMVESRQGFGEDGGVDVAFLIARDQWWRSNLPRRFEATEWYSQEHEYGLLREIVAWDGDFAFESWRVLDGTIGHALAKANAISHRLVVCASGQWLQVDAVKSPFEDWHGTLAAQCQDPQLRMSIISRWMRPFEYLTVEEAITRWHVVSIGQAGERTLILELALTDLIAERRGTGVQGPLGWRIKFDGAMGWRPTSIAFCVADPGESIVASSPRVRFGDVTACVEFQDDWSDWRMEGGVFVPFVQKRHVFVVGGNAVNRLMTAQLFEFNGIDVQRTDMGFDLVPPSRFGTRGKLRRAESGFVEVFDANPIAARLAQRERIVESADGIAASAIEGRNPEVDWGRLMDWGLRWLLAVCVLACTTYLAVCRFRKAGRR